MSEQILDGGQRRANAQVFGDIERFVQRHVEIAAHQHALASDIQIGDGQLGHRAMFLS